MGVARILSMNLTIRLSEPKTLAPTSKVSEHLQFNVGLKITEGYYLGMSGFRLMDGVLSPPAVRGARGKYFNQVIFSPAVAEEITNAVKAKTWGASLSNSKYLVYTEKDHERLFGDASAEADRLRAENAALKAKLLALQSVSTGSQAALDDLPPWDDRVTA